LKIANFRCQVSGVRCRGVAVLIPRMKLRQIGTANRRISNKKFRMMKCGIAALSRNEKVMSAEC
jgi:hypothetical protein